MSKKLRTALIILIIALAVFLIAVFVVRPLYFFYTTGDNIYDTESTPEIAEKYDYVDYDEDSDSLYVNDEILVIASLSADRKDIEIVAAKYNASIVGEMEDIGYYKFRFPETMNYEEIEETAYRLSCEDAVEYAYPTTLFEMESDAFDPEETRQPDYPQDPWNNASWNVDVPRGDNWGAEAVRAPLAWAYSDEFSNVNVGLIDSMVNVNHPDLDVTAAYYTLTENGTTTYDITNTNTLTPDDHGTHVAGTIAGTWNTTGVSGIAGDNVDLYYSCAYYSRNGRPIGDYYDGFCYLQAINALVDRDVKVINISQNTSRPRSYAATKGDKEVIAGLEREANIASEGLQRMLDSGDDFLLCISAGNSNNMTFYKDDSQPYGYRDYTYWWKFWEIGESGDVYTDYNNFLALIDDDDVRDIIVVVGSVGIDNKKSTGTETRYKYSYFSNIGERVDVVAPGEYIYSSTVNGYSNRFRGTSMSTPHVTGVASMVYASNPDLTGSEVKRILLASTYGRYYYTDGYSGMVDAEKAVKFALESKDKSVSAVVKDEASSGLDICFVVDTTGSMGDDIDNAKDNMESILQEISLKNSDFRVALIDYRDFSQRTAYSVDYPAKLQLGFSDDMEEITTAINDLELGNGGDSPETVYSALMMCADLNWRDRATKVIILLGDAEPLDPEPYTDYTLGDTLLALYNADISISEKSDDRVLGPAEDSIIKVFTIGTDASYDARDVFTDISDATGGTYTGVNNSSEVSDAIISSIEQIELIPLMDVSFDLGDSFSDEAVDISRGGEYLFTVRMDEEGEFFLEDMEMGDYEWSVPRLSAKGRFTVTEEKERAIITKSRASLGDTLAMFYMRNTALVWITVILLPCLAVLIVFVVKYIRKNKAQIAETFSRIAPKKPAAAQNKFKYCINCGTKLPYDAAFCAECGSKQNMN